MGGMPGSNLKCTRSAAMESRPRHHAPEIRILASARLSLRNAEAALFAAPIRNLHCVVRSCQCVRCLWGSGPLSLWRGRGSRANRRPNHNSRPRACASSPEGEPRAPQISNESEP